MHNLVEAELSLKICAGGDALESDVATAGSTAEAGVLVQLLGLRPNATAGAPLASNLVGAYTSSRSAGTLLFTLPKKASPLLPACAIVHQGKL